MDTNNVNVEGVEEDIKNKILDLTDKCAVIEMSRLLCNECNFVTSFNKNHHLFESPGYPLPVVETRVITDDFPTF